MGPILESNMDRFYHVETKLFIRRVVRLGIMPFAPDSSRNTSTLSPVMITSNFWCYLTFTFGVTYDFNKLYNAQFSDTKLNNILTFIAT